MSSDGRVRHSGESLVLSLARFFWGGLYKSINLFAGTRGDPPNHAETFSQACRKVVFVRYVNTLPDRQYWQRVILPTVQTSGWNRLLFVGCEPYTNKVHEPIEQHGVECWTTDIVPENARWGNPQRHITADVAKIDEHFTDGYFDAILFNGVMGYGVDGELMKKVAPALERVLHDEGVLLIGWNQGNVEDPCTLNWVTALFEHKAMRDLPERMTFAKSTHVFDWFVKRDPYSKRSR